MGPAVLSLAEKLSQRQSNVLPMMVEGPVGTVLTAVGEHEDHKIAGSVLAHAQEQRVSNNIPMTRELAKAGGRSFGMVYEHRDAFGKPIYVGHSAGVAEERFAIDRERHQVRFGWLHGAWLIALYLCAGREEPSYIRPGKVRGGMGRVWHISAGAYRDGTHPHGDMRRPCSTERGGKAGRTEAVLVAWLLRQDRLRQKCRRLGTGGR